MPELSSTVLGTFLLVTVFGAVIWSVVRTFKDRNKPHRGQVPPITYGSWQDHNLGTTDLEPGDLTRLERELKAASKREE